MPIFGVIREILWLATFSPQPQRDIGDEWEMCSTAYTRFGALRTARDCATTVHVALNSAHGVAGTQYEVEPFATDATGLNTRAIHGQ